MSRKLLEISYLGTNYCGWQVQPNGVSVQSTLQDALEKVLKHRPNITGCSRTDSGVHAQSFYCHFDTNVNIPNDGLVLGLNTFLSDDISAKKCIDVADDFHARYDALGKTYKYKFVVSNIKDPFLAGRVLFLKQPIDIKLANEYCNLLVGKHDFAAFSSIHRTVEDTVRTVSECYVTESGNTLEFSVTADGFLYNMVRIMVGGLLEFSKKKITQKDILSAFENQNRKILGATAPPQALYLSKVHYKKEIEDLLNI